MSLGEPDDLEIGPKLPKFAGDREVPLGMPEADRARNVERAWARAVERARVPSRPRTPLASARPHTPFGAQLRLKLPGLLAFCGNAGLAEEVRTGRDHPIDDCALEKVVRGVRVSFADDPEDGHRSGNEVAVLVESDVPEDAVLDGRLVSPTRAS